MIFGPCQETSYTAITLNPESNFTRPREESLPIPMKYIDVSRTTHTNLDVKQEWSIDDYWNIDGSRNLSEPWTGFTQFTLLKEKPPDGINVVLGQTDKTAANIQARSFMARALEVNGESTPSWRRSKSGLMKSFTSITHENYEESISSTLRTRNLRRPSRMLARNWKHQLLPLCPAKLWKNVGVVHPTKFRRNLRVFW